MIVIEDERGLEATSIGRGSAITVGTFDGVHRGHQDVAAQLVALAATRDLTSLLLTFEPHPLEIVNPSAAPPILTTRVEKLTALEHTGVDVVVVLPFTPELAALSAEAFVDDVLRGRYRLQALLVGHDHGFGRNRMGDASVLQELGAARGFTVDLVAPVQSPEGYPVSSTAIRRAVAGGDLPRAQEALGRPYSVTGEVVHGDKRGRVLGYPTLNLSPVSPRKLLPPDGVYAVRVTLPQGTFGGMLNLGARPTWGETERRLEAHLFDVSGEWYGERADVAFLARLREVRRFDDPAALKSQLALDEALAREVLGT